MQAAARKLFEEQRVSQRQAADGRQVACVGGRNGSGVLCTRYNRSAASYQGDNSAYSIGHASGSVLVPMSR